MDIVETSSRRIRARRDHVDLLNHEFDHVELQRTFDLAYLSMRMSSQMGQLLGYPPFLEYKPFMPCHPHEEVGAVPR